MIGRRMGRNGGKNSTKTGKTAGKKVLNVAKYLSFYHCYLILCDVKMGEMGYPTTNNFVPIN